MTHKERIADRRRNVAVLHEQGKSLRQIAMQLRVGRTTIHRDLEALAEAVPSAGVPAGPGNTRAMTHGLDSQRVVGKIIEPRALELAPEIVAAHGHLDPVRDGAAVFRLAMVYARQEHAYRWLAGQDDELFVDRDAGEVHALYGRIAAWEAQAGREEERLAISPLVRTRLKLENRQLLAGGAGDRRDYSRLSDEELEHMRALHAKAEGTVAGELAS